jgi:arylsulfatase
VADARAHAPPTTTGVRRLLRVLVAAAFSLGTLAAQGAAANIVLIVADDLGYTDLGAWGSEIPTPNIDALAASGVQLMNFHASASCTPSRAMLLTGRVNHAVGYGANPAAVRRLPVLASRPGYAGRLPDDVVTLAEHLQTAGYATYLAGKWHLGEDAGSLPPARGYERSFFLLQGGASHFADATGTMSHDPVSDYFDEGEPVAALPEDFFSTRFYTDRGLAYLDAERPEGTPFFLHLAYTAPHFPLHAPDDWIDRFAGVYDGGWEEVRDGRLARLREAGLPVGTQTHPLPEALGAWEDLTPEARRREARRMEIYAAMVAHLDAEIGRLLEALEARGELDDTIVVFLSDNGPEGNDVLAISGNREWIPEAFDQRYENMGRPGSYVWMGRGWAHVSAGPLARYKSYLTEGGTRVPAIISWPAGIEGGRRSGTVVSAMDLMPTILDLAGLSGSAGDFGMQGESLATGLRDPSAAAARETPLALEIYGNKAVWDGRWKLLWNWEEERWNLFDLTEDPGETADLAAAHAERVATMAAFWEAFAERHDVYRFDREMGYGRYPDQRAAAAGER